MSMTQGRRRPDNTGHHELEPGDYALQTWTKPPQWWCQSPDGRNGNLSRHQVVEHEDGTITVSPSILVSSRWSGEEFSWHGYLERGVWREV
jgi:hypothetical protein